ncbi:MAG: TonB family protein [Myxococcales bacterium]|nr:TonB family protein [Myxococcales bacterium]
MLKLGTVPDLLLALCLWSPSALAEEPPAPEAAPQPAPEPASVPAPAASAEGVPEAVPVGTPTLPVLLSQLPGTYPPAALAQGKEASVLLELDVGETGVVRGARVLEPAGDGFDEAAVQASRGFVFQPARDELGAPTEARIQYRYRFSVARAAPPSVEGRVTDRASNIPFPGLDVRVVGADGSVAYTVTDTDGHFVLSGLPVGAWTVIVSPPGHVVIAAPVEVKPDVVAQLTLTAQPSEEIAADRVVTVTAERTSPELTERILSQEEVRFLPGTGGDVVKAVQNLPGVARAPLGVGQLIIRGTAPEDSAYFLDGASIPIVFHFSGLSTILNGDFIAEVAYLPGNYGARYGRALGGLVDLRTTDVLPEKSGGYVSLDFFQGTAWVEQKVGKNTALEFSLRRSWIDTVLSPVLSSSNTTFRAPRYWDAQARVFHRTPSGGAFDALVLFSDDRFSVVGSSNDSVAIGLTTTFGKLRARWMQPLANDWRNELTVIGGPENQAFAFDGDPEAAYERRFGFGLREELVQPVSPSRPIGWRIGADLQGGQDSFLYNVVAFSPYESDATWLFAPALYAEPTFRLGPVSLTPGLRGDAKIYDFGVTYAAFDPRLSARLVASSTTLVKASVGRYSQFPTTRQVAPGGDGNPDLLPEWSLQSSLGLVQQLPLGFSVEATAFYNRLYALVVGREDRFKFFTGPPPVGPFDTEGYANAGTGRVCGTELLVRMNANKTFGLLSATFSSSVRYGRNGEQSLFENDQPFVINALASQELPKRWRIGVRGRVSAGDPYTPVVNRVYDLQSRSFFPIYGETDSARLPATWSVDVRVDKEWKFNKWSLTTYLDLQNAFNVQNPEVMSWSYDYSEETPISGLPIIPALGIRGEI